MSFFDDLKPKEKKFKVEAWGKEILVRKLNIDESLKFNKLYESKNLSKKGTNADELIAFQKAVVCEAAKGPDGQKITMEDLGNLETDMAIGIRQIFDEIMSAQTKEKKAEKAKK